jgi:hypothetical protein
MSDVFAAVLGELRRHKLELTAEELCDTLWLLRLGAGASARSNPVCSPEAVADGDTFKPAPPPTPTAGNAGGRGPRRVPGRAGASNELVPAYLTGQAADDGARPVPAADIRLAGSRALPQARAIAEVLRPLRYDTRRIQAGAAIDEMETAHRTARTGIRLPVWQTTRRRRLDLDLVLDLGGSGVLWARVATELRALLEGHGAFRSVRPWTLDSDSAVPADGSSPAPRLRAGLPGDAVQAGAGPTRYPPSAICQPPRRPLVMVVTDGTGDAWWTGAIHPALREWGKYGRVVLLLLLPPRMWGSTALSPVPVTFLPTEDGYHRGAHVRADDADLSVVGLDRSTLPGATAVPVAALDPGWLRAWVPLLRGGQAGEVAAFALLIPGASDEAPVAPPARPAGHWQPSPAQRIRQFLLMASDDAFRLTWFLSKMAFTPAVMRKVQQELVPGSGPTVLAEVLLGGLVSRWSATDDGTAPDNVVFDFLPGVRELLPEPPSGGPNWDPQSVARALASGVPGDLWYHVRTPAASGDSSVIRSADGASLPVFFDGGRRPAESVRPTTDLPAVNSRRASGSRVIRPVQVSLWGAPQSGKSTYLTVLSKADWKPSRLGGLWRVMPADAPTHRHVSASIQAFDRDGRFPDATMRPAHLSFRLLRQRGRLSWLLGAAREADIGVSFTDRGGGDFGPDPGWPDPGWPDPGGHGGGPARTDVSATGVDADALATLSDADGFVYFFDPTYDMDDDTTGRTLNFFDAAMTSLSRIMHDRGSLLGPYLPQHMAVYITKLDDSRVFSAARRSYLVETRPGSDLPWVPDKHARRLFEALCRTRMTPESDYLLNRIPELFHPRRISFHVISSVGFWMGDAGGFNPNNSSNVVPGTASGGAFAEDAHDWRVRGEIRPVNVLEPLVTLVQNARRTQR